MTSHAKCPVIMADSRQS